MEQNIALQSKSESSDFLKWVKAYSPAIDFAASTAISFGIAYCSPAPVLWSIGLPVVLIPMEAAKNWLLENTEVVGEGHLKSTLEHGYTKSVIDNLSGSAILNAVEGTSKFQANVTSKAYVNSLEYGLHGVGQGTVVSQLANKASDLFNGDSEKYSFDNTLLSLRFGAYFFIKTVMTKGLLGDSILAKAFSGMVAGGVSKTLVKAGTYLLNEEGFENFWSSASKDVASMFVNSGLYGVHDLFSFGYVGDVLIDANIEAIDAVIKKDILGNNKDEAVIHSVYDFAHTEAVQTVCDAVIEVKDWVFEQCGYSSEEDYQSSIVACA